MCSRPICLSGVWLQTELDNTKSYYQLIIKINYNLAKLWKKGPTRKLKHSKATAPPISSKVPKTQKQAHAHTRTHTQNYNFECDWLIELSDNKLITNCLVLRLSNNKLFDNKLSDNKLSNNKLFNTKLSDTKLSDTKLSDNKLSNNNLASKLVENRKL